MSRLIIVLVLLASLLLPLAAQANHETIPRDGHYPEGVQPTLIKRYDLKALNNGVRYRPRQFVNGFSQIADVSWGAWTVQDAGAYSGWDVLPPPNEGGTRVATTYPLATYTLNRPAKVALVWRSEAAPADWVAADGWVAAGTVRAYNPQKNWTRTYPTFTRVLPAGTFNIGGNYDAGDTISGTRNLPWLLFAEADGTPSVSPIVPDGSAAPVANQTCPAWVHAVYTAVGPDGKVYPTWHPAIDPVYWCYFRHEHGSDPSIVFPDGDYTPFYGYVAKGMIIPGTSLPMTENHWGHKSAAFQDATGNWIFATQHVGTTGIARANTCLQRFHLVDLVVRNPERTETLVHLQFMADYGRSAVSEPSGSIPYTPTACPNGNAETGYTTSVPTRRIPLATTGQVTYEPWQFHQTRYAPFGLTGTLTINTQQPLDICGSVICDTPVVLPKNAGTSRILQFTNGMQLHDPGLSSDGHFCTDGMLMTRMTCGAPGAVEQYIQPGLHLDLQGTGSLSLTHWETRAWGDQLEVAPGGTLDVDPEGSIQETHGPN